MTHADGPLLRDARAVLPDAIVLGRRSVALTAGCRPTLLPAHGGARLSARLADCEGPRLRLRATAHARCSLLRGTLRAPGAAPTTFVARASRCGDGVVDRLDGERCDDGDTVDGDGCAADCRSCDGAPPLASTWGGFQVNVIVRYGCLRCHDSASALGGVDLRPSVAYEHLVGVPSHTVPGVPRLQPGDRTRSVLWQKLAKGTEPADWESLPGAGMPIDGGLPPEELEAVGRWIDAGAPVEGVVPGTDALLPGCAGGP